MTAPALAPAPPRFAPARSGPTYGGRVARLARALGWRFMPWQSDVSDVLNEYGAGGLRRHPFVVVTVQRQTGKTVWLQCEAVDRCLFGPPGQRVWYTAQSGLYAREKWAEIATRLLAEGSPLAGYVSAKWTNGSECLTFPNGSTFRPFPPTRDALHSMQSDLVIVDESWRHDAVRGAELLQAIGPTQATRPGAQVVLASTAGTAESTWLRGMVDRGRAGDPAITYLEWSIGDGIDPDDLDAVAAAHPAIGRTIDHSFLERERNVLSPNEFARAYGNAWTAALVRHIDAAVWERAATGDGLPAGSAPVFAADVADDRSRSAIVACAGGVCEVIESRAGIDWLPDRLVALRHKWRPAAIVLDPYGPAAPIHDRLDRAGVPLFKLERRQLPAACLSLVDGLTAGRVRYRRHPALDGAAAAAVPRQVGDGWVWSPRRSAGPIPELTAMTLAVWADAHRPAPAARPRVITGR
jgi:hypothetical protein